MSAQWPDVVVSCSEGHEHFVVERFRRVDGRWTSTRRPSTKLTAGDEPDRPELWLVGEGEPIVRERYELRCPRCNPSRNAPAQAERVDVILTMLSHHNAITEISLVALGTALERLPYKGRRVVRPE